MSRTPHVMAHSSSLPQSRPSHPVLSSRVYLSLHCRCLIPLILSHLIVPSPFSSYSTATLSHLSSSYLISSYLISSHLISELSACPCSPLLSWARKACFTGGHGFSEISRKKHLHPTAFKNYLRQLTQVAKVSFRDINYMCLFLKKPSSYTLNFLLCLSIRKLLAFLGRAVALSCLVVAED